MGNNNNKKKYNFEKDIQLEIKLNKACYFPGELINGNLELKPKDSIKDSDFNNFNNTLALVKIIQIQWYWYTEGYGEDEYTVTVSDESNIFEDNIDFINFKGANITLGLAIPFSIKIPFNVHLSCFIGSYYVKHFISFDLPGIDANKILMIFIKGFRHYTIENKLLKTPAIAFGDFYKKKLLNIKVEEFLAFLSSRKIVFICSN